MEIDLEMAIIKDSKAKPVNLNQWGHRPGRRNYIFMFDGSWDTSRSRSAASSMCGGGNRKTLFLTVFSQNLLRGEAVAVDAYKLALPAHGELGVLGFDHGLSLRSIPSCTHFFFEKILLNDELTNLAFQAGGLRFALFDALAGSVLTLEEFSDALLQLLFPCADLSGGDILVDGDLLDGFILLEGFKCQTGFEFGGQMSSFSFHDRDRFTGLIPPHDQPVPSTMS